MPTYTGTTAANTLSGSTAADTLVGLAGNDLYLVNNIGDVVVEASGAGTDTVRTSVLDPLGTYSIATWAYVENLEWAGAAAAILKGNGAANRIAANAAQSTADTLYGAAGNDTLLGYGGNDSLVGGIGNDSLDGGTGADAMIGGTGDDRYVVDSTSDRAYEYASGGFDTLVSSVAKDLRLSWTQFVEGLLYTGTTAATLHGNAGANRIESRSTAGDVLHGYDGNDTLDGGAGTDSMNGGAGDDVYVVESADVVVESADAGTDTLVGLKTSLAVTAFATTVENLFFTGATGSSLTGNNLANVLSGGAGNDTVNGGTGDDTVLGGNGTDSLLGGTGDDLLYGGGNPDVFWRFDRLLVADTSIDRLVGGSGNDRYLIDTLADTITETAASTGGTLDTVVAATDLSLGLYGDNGIEALVLQKGSDAWRGEGTLLRGDILVGNERDNLLVGLGGNDTLAANANTANTTQPQSDVLDGGAGNDVLVAFDYGSFGTTREVTFFGGAGDDLYVIGARTDSVGGSDSSGNDVAVLLGNASLQALAGVETIVLYGADADADIAARAAVRQVYAAANGATAIWRGSFGTATEAMGNDSANTIVGNALDNRLAGGAGNDVIVGGKGADTLDGGSGTDVLDGGLGNDWYVMDTGETAAEAANAGFDVIVSATITSLAGRANFEGLQYTGSTALVMNNGLNNVTADLLGGGRGNDSISGFGGDDTLDGGIGNDTLRGGDGNDQIGGAAGSDSISGDFGDDTIDGGDGSDTLAGGANWDRLAGGNGNDTLYGGDGRDTLDGGAGNDKLYGENNDDTLVGGDGSDSLRGGGSAAEGRSSAFGDHLWGDAQFGTGGGESDLFAFDVLAVDSGLLETEVGSGTYEWIGAATIGDFEPTIDAIGLSALLGGYAIGDGDLMIDGYTETTDAGEVFASAAEFVFVRADVGEPFAYSRSARFDDISAASVAAVLGPADAAIGVGETRIIVLDDGTNSAVFQFLSTNGDAVVDLDELYLIAVVTGTDALQPTDFVLF